MDYRGLSVTVLDDETLIQADLETVLFKKLDELTGLKVLLSRSLCSSATLPRLVAEAAFGRI